MTIIGIIGKMHDVDVTGTSIEVTKTMSANPGASASLKSFSPCPTANTPTNRKP